ncbi:TMEM165/GDT1 family protein [Cognatiluteimonas weifangensis]|uniref:TMEM165/GDT1 family protein n=1 Tax=Cognatiluteimonas weifangensis TaxID=2303539 RepID=UPI001F15EE53|nr:TMEM165/GDT1 family protein [Luteimonas weifangensis]
MLSLDTFLAGALSAGALSGSLLGAALPEPAQPDGLLSGAPLWPALVSTGSVALAEIGDKTQLLALLLAARFRQPGPIVAGILVATLLNHALAGGLGVLAAAWLTPAMLRWIVAASFIAIALWTLKPDKFDDADQGLLPARNAFIATTIAFFVAEIGDKTQVATVLLAANYSPLWQVVAGTTLGMLLANVPVVALGSRFARRLPLRAARIAAALVFLALGSWALAQAVS